MSATAAHSGAILGPLPEPRKPKVRSKQIDLSSGCSLIDEDVVKIIRACDAAKKRRGKKRTLHLSEEDLENSFVPEPEDSEAGTSMKRKSAAVGAKQNLQTRVAADITNQCTGVLADRGRGRPRKN